MAGTCCSAPGDATGWCAGWIRLWLDGTPSTPLGYAQRRELLEGLALAGGHWQTPPYFAGGGRHVLRAAQEQGLPGVVAKRLHAGYLPGRRSRDWLTVDVP